MIRNALAAAGTVQGQLGPDRPGVLALAGLLMSPDTYDTLVTSFELHLRQGWAEDATPAGPGGVQPS